jgi:two-component system, OmpR family, response regulator
MTGPLKIMVVDDDATTLQVLCAALEARGNEVISRETSIGTSRAILREQCDVVVLDVRMPGLSGGRLAALLADRPARHAPVVILHSSMTRAELEKLAHKSGAAGIIEKTGDPDEFIRRFEEIVETAKHPAVQPPASKAKVEKLEHKSGAAGIVEKTGDPDEFIRRFEEIVKTAKRTAVQPPASKEARGEQRK